MDEVSEKATLMKKKAELIAKSKKGAQQIEELNDEIASCNSQKKIMKIELDKTPMKTKMDVEKDIEKDDSELEDLKNQLAIEDEAIHAERIAATNELYKMEKKKDEEIQEQRELFNETLSNVLEYAAWQHTNRLF